MVGTHTVLLSENAITSVDAYFADGGGQALNKALKMPHEQTIAEVKKSGLRGRGGGGFPTGLKWEGVAYDPCPTKYLVCNGSEGEPGSFKDHMLMRNNPYPWRESRLLLMRSVPRRPSWASRPVPR